MDCSTQASSGQNLNLINLCDQIKYMMTHMIFVKKNTPTEFQDKNFTHMCTICDFYSLKIKEFQYIKNQ